jgi:thiol-disulfide isomerase/thioredoxin
MNKKNLYLIIGVVIILSSVVGLAYFSSQDQNEVATNQTSSSSVQIIESEQTSSSSLSQITNSQTPDSSLSASKGLYVDYANFDFAQNNDKKVVLFFKASWCSTCNALDKEILAGNIPTDVAIVAVDYDSQTDLRRKYGIRIQHTLVQVDQNQNEIGKWVGSRNLEELTSKIV